MFGGKIADGDDHDARYFNRWAKLDDLAPS
jgi:hypothetical protein